MKFGARADPMLAAIAISFCVFALQAPAPKQLEIVRPALHQYDGGPSLPAGFRFGRGEVVFVTFRIAGYSATEDRLIHLAYRVEVADPRGVPVAEPLEKELKSELAPQDKDWMPMLRHNFQIPPLAERGDYRVTISAEDKLSGKKTGVEIPFQVRAPMVKPSETVTARNFRFLKSEDGTQALDPPVYHRGDMLWARFEITGYKFGEKNRIEVEYGLSVLGPTGKELYSEPRAAVETSTPFYPNRYLPGVLSLNLEKAQRGEYTILLTLRDNVGNQTGESRHVFRVE